MNLNHRYHEILRDAWVHLKEIPGPVRKMTPDCFFLLAGMSDSEFERLCENFSVESFIDGEYLIREGDKTRDLIVLISGEVRIVRKNDDDIPQLVRYVDQPLSIFGEINFVMTDRRTADAIAAGDVEALSLTGEFLDSLMEENDVLGYKLAYNILMFLMKRRDRSNYDVLHLMDQLRKCIKSPGAR